MELTLSSKALGKAIVITWVAFAVIWQLILMLFYPLHGVDQIRFTIMLVKPFFFAALIFAGHSWPRIAVGIIGPISAFFVLLKGFMTFDDDGLGAIVAIVGAIIYTLLSLAIMLARPLNQLRH